MEQYICFKKDYVGANTKKSYIKGVKYKINDIKNDCYFFSGDKVEIKFLDKIYEVGDIKSKYPKEIQNK